MPEITFGSLFAGIGGFDLGFERAGMVCKWQVEIDEYARRVLAKHWPHVRRWDDVRTFPPKSYAFEYSWRGSRQPPWGPDTKREAARELWGVDVICGGFPCQDISYAGRGAGLEGERSGLFFEMVRVVRQLRPRFVVLENVAALLTRGLDVVLGTLAEIGFDAEWHCIPAASVGAPHIRDRVFILAYARHGGIEKRPRSAGSGEEREKSVCQKSRCDGRDGELEGLSTNAKPMGCPEGSGIKRDEEKTQERRSESEGGSQVLANDDCGKCDSSRQSQEEGWPANMLVDGSQFARDGNWAFEPAVGRVAHGVPNRVDRLRGLGNAVVPQVAEWIGRRIVESDFK